MLSFDVLQSAAFVNEMCSLNFLIHFPLRK